MQQVATTAPTTHSNGKPADNPSAETLTGAEIFVRALEDEGVEIVFGHPGGATIQIYDAMARLKPSFEHILVRHEQGGTHAAEGYAKASGRVGTVLVTSGPGATNTVTGIADAYLDSIPLVVFTGQVPTAMIGNDAFQETDTVGVTRSITKHNFLVRNVADLAETIRQAYHLARTGRPGPVVVDLPKDMQMATAKYHYPDKPDLRGYSFPTEIASEQIDQAARMINEAERPLLYVGGGCIYAEASDELRDMAKAGRIPVTTTLHGLGAFPETDDLSLGMLGMHGTWYANQAVQNCDVLIAVGARFDDRVTGKVEAWAPHARIIHIDIDPACISKNVFADCPIPGDAKAVLKRLVPNVNTGDLSAWHRQIEGWKKECPLDVGADDHVIRPQRVIHKLSEKVNGRAIVVTDVGQHQMWAAQHFNFSQPRTHITSGGLGTMGFCVPAAMGAAFAQRELPVIGISGDGGFVMNDQELTVAAKHKLPLKLAVLNNNYLGMVRQWQDLFHGERFSHTDLEDTNPDFVRLAEAHHCVGLRASHPDEVDAMLEEAWSVNDRPVVMEFQVPKEEKVFPMVPSGAASDEMLTAENFRDVQ